MCEARGGGRARDDDTSDGGRGEGVVSTVGTLVCGRAGGSRSVHGRTVGAVRKTNAALMVVERRAEVHAFSEYPEGPATTVIRSRRSRRGLLCGAVSPVRNENITKEPHTLHQMAPLNEASALSS